MGAESAHYASTTDRKNIYWGLVIYPPLSVRMADIDTPVDAIAPGDGVDEPAPPQPMMPPREESGFPSLPWAAAGANELFRACPPPSPHHSLRPHTLHPCPCPC